MGAHFVLGAIVVAAFGPYLAAGVRTEQAVIYGLFVVILPFRFMVMHIPKAGLPVIGAWILYVLAAVLGLALPIINRTDWVSQSVFAGMDNLVLPLALVGVTWAVLSRGRAGEMLGFVARVVAVVTAVNGLLAMLMTRVDLTAAVRPFIVAPGVITMSTADYAAQLGRFSGVFNQPAEAGLAYGVAGLAACYGWRNKPAVMYLLLIPIVLGGLLCVSKVFVLGGLPLILWQLLRGSRRSKAPLIVVAVCSVLIVMQTGFLSQWAGFSFLARLFNPDSTSGLITLYTAGRLGDQATLPRVIDAVWTESPVTGFGVAGLKVPYDNGWVEALVVAGVIGIVAYTLTLAAIGWMARTDAERERRSFLTSVAILAIGASLGIPALTANRAGSLLWLIIAVGALAHERRPPRIGRDRFITALPAPAKSS